MKLRSEEETRPEQSHIRRPREEGAKKRRKIFSILIAAIIILAAVGLYLFLPDPKDTKKKPIEYHFGINTRWTGYFYNYIVTFTEKTEKEDVVVTVSRGGIEVPMDGSEIQEMNENQFLISPGFQPVENEDITIEVFRNGELMGARTVVPIMTDWDETTVGSLNNYDFYHALYEETYDGRERVVRNMNGRLLVEKTGEVIRSNFTGKGITRIEQHSEGSDVEFDIEVDEHISGVENRGGESSVIYSMERGSGSGSAYFNIEGAGELTAELEVEEYLTESRDNNLTDTTMRANGEFQGDLTGTIEMDTYKTGEEVHDNHLGINYSCMVVEGVTKIKVYQATLPIYITSRQKVWNVKSLDYQYGTIYYEVNYTISGQESGEESAYVDDAPQPTNIMIDDVINVRGLVPSEIMTNDTFTFSSIYGYRISYQAVSPARSAFVMAKDPSPGSIILMGEVVEEGNGTDLLVLIPDGKNSFIQQERHSAFSWGNEFRSANMTRRD